MNKLVENSLSLVPLDEDKVYTAVILDLIVDGNFLCTTTAQLPLDGCSHMATIEVQIGLSYEPIKTNNNH